MGTIRDFFDRRDKVKSEKQESGARMAMLEELFNDIYGSRRRIYKINFVRGVFFGAGSALGGTVVIASLVWVLSLFVNVPLIGEAFRGAQNSIEHNTTETSR